MIYKWLDFKILITHPPVRMQLYGDPGVFVPDKSYPFAWHWDDDVESHSVYGVKRMLLRSPAIMVEFGHPHVTQCQGDSALGRSAQVQIMVFLIVDDELQDLTGSWQFICHKIRL